MTIDLNDFPEAERLPVALAALKWLASEREVASGRFPKEVFFELLLLLPTVYIEVFVFRMVGSSLEVRLVPRPTSDPFYAGLYAGFGGMLRMRETVDDFFCRFGKDELGQTANFAFAPQFCGVQILDIPREHGIMLLHGVTLRETPEDLPGVWVPIKELSDWEGSVIPSTTSMIKQVLDVMFYGPPKLMEFHHRTDLPE